MDDTDISSLRLSWESADQWDLRQAFIRRHWGSESKNRLVSLSQILVNMEFMGCQELHCCNHYRYDPELVKKVHEMAVGLVDERRSERRKVIEETFLKGYDGKSATLKRRKIDERPSNPFNDSKKVRNEESNEQPQKSVAAGPLAIKEKLLTLVKAQLSVAPSHMDGLALLNHVCGRAKTDWLFDKNDTKCHLSISSVHIVVLMNDSKKSHSQLRLSACQMAIKRLQNVIIQVIQNESDPQRLTLYTNAGKRAPWIGPDEHLHMVIEEQLRSAAQKIALKSTKVLKDPEKCLQEVGEELNLSFSVDLEHLGGWRQKLSAFFAGILINTMEVQGKECGKDRMDANRSRLCLEALEMVTKKTLKVVEDDDGRLGLVAVDGDQSTDEQIRTALTSDDWFSSNGQNELILFQSRMNIDEKSKSILLQSANFSKLPISINVDFLDGQHQTSVVIHSVVVARASGNVKKSTSLKACDLALSRLRKICYTLILKDQATIVGDAETVQLEPDKKQNESPKITGIGMKLLEKMGWKEGIGVGRHDQGIVEPITVSQLVGRGGLGFQRNIVLNYRQLRSAARRLLRNFIADHQQQQLVFSEQLAKEQRKIVHSEAMRRNLVTKSYNVDNGRRLRVSKKRTALQLLVAVLCGQENGYILRQPNNSSLEISP